jgi:hypothetical protein
MKPLYLTASFLFLFFSAFSQEGGISAMYGSCLVSDSAQISLTPGYTFEQERVAFAKIPMFFHKTGASKAVIYTTKKGRQLEAYYFPGLSDKKALVVGGMHGSELSSVAVARMLVEQLAKGEKQFYSVVVIPCLFPDNAAEADGEDEDRVSRNTGRYTSPLAADPNRQMPLLGKPFDPEVPVDAMHREIEGENQALLQLIQVFAPDRMINIHAIRDRNKAGVFADPRTDCLGYAVGFESDKALALMMAQYIQSHGAPCPGNALSIDPTALYHLDPAVADEGKKQKRSFNGSHAAARGQGVSLGSWASTAVCDPNGIWSRPAIRTFTMEFPGYLKPSEYHSKEDQKAVEKSVQVYASSIRQLFLQSYFVEEGTNGGKLFARQ